MDGQPESKGGTKSDDIDDGAYADRTLHTALTFLHGSYNIKNLTNMVSKRKKTLFAAWIRGNDLVFDNVIFYWDLACHLSFQLQETRGHQALATVYTLERQYSQAMHHHLCALLKQSGGLYKLEGKENSSNHEGADIGEKEANCSSQEKQNGTSPPDKR